MNPMEVNAKHLLRDANDFDVPAITDLINCAFSVERFFKTGDRTDEAQVHDLMRTGSFLLLTEHDSLIACVYVKITGERSYIGMLAVDPAQQKSGLGSRMMREAEDLSRRAGCKFVDLRVVDIRPELSLIYGKIGYVETSVSAANIESATRPVNFVTMSKRL
ncbi:MAG TPA: GNAT family N-acetyltransferase [Candidatus Bathyarchaeia archaeon]|nr:GNAT family N-acetyltransferase [Candidatus Bathyarchaeia archaeon]